jgi:hypothetical protein
MFTVHKAAQIVSFQSATSFISKFKVTSKKNNSKSNKNSRSGGKKGNNRSINKDKSNNEKSSDNNKSQYTGVQAIVGMDQHRKVSFKILDSKGQHHNFIINKLYYCAMEPMKIISPQHLDTMWKERDSSHQLLSPIDSVGCVLQWIHKDKAFNKLIQLIIRKQVSQMFKSSPGYQHLANYLAKHHEITYDDQAICCQAAYVIEDDTSISSDQQYDLY